MTLLASAFKRRRLPWCLFKGAGQEDSARKSAMNELFQGARGAQQAVRIKRSWPTQYPCWGGICPDVAALPPGRGELPLGENVACVYAANLHSWARVMQSVLCSIGHSKLYTG